MARATQQRASRSAIQSQTKAALLGQPGRSRGCHGGLCGSSPKENRNPLPPQGVNLASDIRTTWGENRDAWNVLGFERNSPAPRRDWPKLTAPPGLFLGRRPGIPVRYTCLHSPLTVQAHLPSASASSFLPVSQICPCVCYFCCCFPWASVAQSIY